MPVWLYEGKILDGRNRWAACKIAGVTPKTQEYKGDEPTAFAVALNDRRRHMGKSALAAVAAELEPHFAEDAKRRQQKAGKEHGRGQKVVEKVPQPIDAKPLSKSREEAAKSVGVNDRYVSDAKKVKPKTLPDHDDLAVNRSKANVALPARAAEAKEQPRTAGGKMAAKPVPSHDDMAPARRARHAGERLW